MLAWCADVFGTRSIYLFIHLSIVFLSVTVLIAVPVVLVLQPSGLLLESPRSGAWRLVTSSVFVMLGMPVPRGARPNAKKNNCFIMTPASNCWGRMMRLTKATRVCICVFCCFLFVSFTGQHRNPTVRDECCDSQKEKEVLCLSCVVF